VIDAIEPISGMFSAEWWTNGAALSRLCRARHAVAPGAGGRRRLVRGPERSYCEPGRETENMPVRLKKLIGTVLLILLVIVYALVATAVAVAQLAESGPLTHFVFFLVTGLLWILPAMAIIKWMVLPPKAER
jgi:hypothetical protein